MPNIFRGLAVGSLLLVVGAFSHADAREGDDESLESTFEPSRWARKAFADLVKADDARVIRCLPKRWEKMKKVDQKDLLMICLRHLDSTKQTPLRNPQNILIPSRADWQARADRFGHGWTVFQDLYFENGRCAWAVEQLLTTDPPVGYRLGVQPCEQHREDRKNPEAAQNQDAFESRPTSKIRDDQNNPGGPKTDRPKYATFTEETIKDANTLEKTILLAYKAVIQRMELPRGHGRNARLGESMSPEEHANHVLGFILGPPRGRRISKLPSIKRWSITETEATQKCLIFKLLEDLDDPGELRNDDILQPQAFVMSRYLNNVQDAFSDEGEMLEQDIHVVNGRCAWALEKLLKTTLPTFDAKLVKDKKKLKESIVEAHLRVIEAMKMPDQPWVRAYKEDDD